MKAFRLALALAGALLAGGCDRDSSPRLPIRPTSPPPTTPPPPPVAPEQVTRLTISGTAAIPAIGATTQLTAAAQLGDGSTKDVTALATWSTSDAGTLVVSAGLATAVRLGVASISARYGGKFANMVVKATPPGTYAIWGRAREPGSGGIAGVAITTPSGPSFVTSDSGDYTFGGLNGTTRLTFSKAEFEPVALNATPDAFQDVPMQRVLRVAAGQTVEWTLAPHDMDYIPALGSHCYPCRLVRLPVDTAGTIDLDVTWKELHSELSMWINGQVFTRAAADTPRITASLAAPPGELQIYIGLAKDSGFYVPVTFAAKIR